MGTFFDFCNPTEDHDDATAGTDLIKLEDLYLQRLMDVRVPVLHLLFVDILNFSSDCGSGHNVRDIAEELPTKNHKIAKNFDYCTAHST